MLQLKVFLKKCLDYDYNHSKLPKLFDEGLLLTLEKHYRTIKNSY